MVHAGPVSLCMKFLVPFTRESKPVLVCLKSLVPLGPHPKETGEKASQVEATCCGTAKGQQSACGGKQDSPQHGIILRLTHSSINTVVSKC